MVEYVRYWSDRAETPTKTTLDLLDLATSKFRTWKDRYGKVKEHDCQRAPQNRPLGGAPKPARGLL